MVCNKIGISLLLDSLGPAPCLVFIFAIWVDCISFWPGNGSFFAWRSFGLLRFAARFSKTSFDDNAFFLNCQWAFEESHDNR